MARRLTARPSPAWVGDLPVFERTLANGFKALVLPRTHAPVVVCDLYYPVGSVDEPAGQDRAGALRRAHAVQGDRAVPQGADRPPGVRRGGPVERRDRRGLHALLVRLPVRPLGAGAGGRGRPDARGDRSTRARSRPSGTSSSRSAPATSTRPLGRLDQTHLAVAYLRHPYRNPILGWPDDLARITRRRPPRLLPTALPARRGGAGGRRRRRARGGARPGRSALRPTCRGAVPRPRAAWSSEPRQTGPARLHAGRVRIGRRGACSAGTRCRAAIPTARRSTCSPTC